MGCNQTKSADVSASSRTKIVEPPNQSRSQNTNPVGIGVDKKILNEKIKTGIPKSYSDQREMETEFTKRIIDDTISKFIDITTTIAPLEAHNTKKKIDNYGKRYRAKAQKIELNSLSLFQGLPNIKSPSFDPLIALKSNTLSTNFMKEYSNSIGSAIHFKIKNCGDFIVPFIIDVSTN